MISRLVYVSCDRCGVPADEGTIDGAKEARAVAQRRGFVRVPHPDPAMVGTMDLCRECAKAES